RSAERSLRRKNVDRRIDRGDLGLNQALEFLELLFIVSQLMPTARRRNVLVEHVGVVVVPSAGTDSQQCARRHGRGQRRQACTRQAAPWAQGTLGAAPAI